MIFREANPGDISQLMNVRFSVNENVLSNRNLVTEKHCEEYLTMRGKGWVCEINKQVVGFSIADLKDHNVWALFVKPNYEGKGIGKKLQKMMLDWYFSQTKERIWLSTSPGTRAELFYRKNGWMEKGMLANGEVKFEMSWEDWERFTTNK